MFYKILLKGDIGHHLPFYRSYHDSFYEKPLEKGVQYKHGERTKELLGKIDLLDDVVHEEKAE